MKFLQRLSNLNQQSLIQKFLAPDKNDELKIMTVDRKPTASDSISSFFEAVGFFKDNINAPSALTISSVGMKVDGRSSVFDLWWFPTDKNNFFAVDAKDENFVASTTNR